MALSGMNEDLGLEDDFFAPPRGAARIGAPHSTQEQAVSDWRSVTGASVQFGGRFVSGHALNRLRQNSSRRQNATLRRWSADAFSATLRHE